MLVMVVFFIAFRWIHLSTPLIRLFLLVLILLLMPTLNFLLVWFALILLRFFFNDTATTEIYTLSLHDALPILSRPGIVDRRPLAAEIGQADQPVRSGSD